MTVAPDRVIDGKAAAARVRTRVAEGVAAVGDSHGIVPGLAAVLVGEDPASQVYVRSKNRQTVEAGMRSVGRSLPGDATERQLLDVVGELNDDPDVHAILVQLPLPGHIRVDAVIDAMRPEKDVDGFHPHNVGRLASGRDAMVPCTPLGCMMLLEDRLGDLAGMEAVVVGRSNIVGRPMAQLLLGASCTVTVAHSRTRDLPAVCRRADILVAAVGRPRMIGGDWIKPGAVVIDVGINRLPPEGGGRGRLVGDVDFDAAVEVAAAVTPVPGGVGPMTIACLLRNTLVAACRQNGVEPPV